MGQVPTGEGLGGRSTDLLLTPSETGKHPGSLNRPAPSLWPGSLWLLCRKEMVDSPDLSKGTSYGPTALIQGERANELDPVGAVGLWMFGR